MKEIIDQINSLRFSEEMFVELLYLINKAKEITITINGAERKKNKCLHRILLVEERELRDFKDKRDQALLSKDELKKEFHEIQLMTVDALRSCE